ncbi:zinc finger domain-containing protein [Streptomyces celluloflavus]|uniref:zinc finger domain-containing protein n=1 Tax=Streptomyces celluloflavus TaxID=58344 RepID=UPI0036AD1975
MTLAELSEVLGFAALYDNRTLGEAEVRAWHLIVGHLDADDTRQAIAEHYGQTRDRLMPSDLLQRGRRIRDQRLGTVDGPGLPAHVPDADPHDVPAYLTALREGRYRPEPANALPRYDPDTHFEDFRKLPTDKRPGPLGTRCPKCAAPPGRSCTTPKGRRLADPHPSRTDPTHQNA